MAITYSTTPSTRAIPASGQVIYAAPNGSSTADGLTVANAVTINRAASLVTNGGTVVLKGGIYRLSSGVNFGNKSNITVQSCTNERAILSGFQSLDGNAFTLVNNQYIFSGYTTMMVAFPTTDKTVDWTNNPQVAHKQMVFVAGAKQTSANSLANTKAGCFFYDATSGRMILGSNPAGKTVECANVNNGMNSNGVGFRIFDVTIIGCGIGHQVTNNDAVVEGCDFSYNSYRGLSISSNFRNRVERSRFTYNGCNGFTSGTHNTVPADSTRSLLFKGNYLLNNTQLPYDPNWSFGSAKIIRAVNPVIEDNYFHDDGSKYVLLWLDINVTNAAIRGNICSGAHIGIFYEISNKGYLSRNILINNNIGIHLLHSEDCEVYNNTFVNNTAAINVSDHNRRTSTEQFNGGNWIARRNRFFNNLVMVDVAGKYTFFGVPTYKSEASSNYLVESDYNLYVKAANNSPNNHVRWQPQGGTEAPITYEAFRTLGYDANSSQRISTLDTVVNSSFVPISGSPAIRATKTLTAAQLERAGLTEQPTYVGALSPAAVVTPPPETEPVTVEQLQEEIVSLKAQVTTLSEQLDQALADLQAEVDSIATLTEEFQSQLAAKDQTIAELQSQLVSKDQTIASLQSDLTTKDQAIAVLQSESASKDQVIADLQAELAAANQTDERAILLKLKDSLASLDSYQ